MMLWRGKGGCKFGLCAAVAIGIGAIAMLVSRPSFEPFPSETALPGVSIGNNLPADYEASSIVWHPRLERFFLVCDEGIVSSMCNEGEDLRHWPIGGDLEATTIACPQSDFIYIGGENPDRISEFCVVTASVTRRFELSDWMQGPNNGGLEALAFVPDPDDPEGGLFYAGLQSNGSILVFRLPIASSTTSTEVVYLRTIPSHDGVEDISALHYAADHRTIYAIYDRSNLLRAMTPDGTVLREWKLPGRNQEGLTFKGDAMYVCSDHGRKGGDVVRYAPFAGITHPDE